MGTSRVIVVGRDKPSLKLRFRHKFSRPKFQLKRKGLNALLHDSELAAIQHLNTDVIKKKNISLFYPGCGMDIAQPLVYFSKLSSADKATFVLADKHINANTVVKLVIRLTGNHNYRVKTNTSSETVTFNFKDKTLKFVCRKGDVFAGLPKELAEGYDVYFERAFELFRADHPEFMLSSLHKLNQGGLVITDAGLTKKMLTDFDKIPVKKEIKELGFYKKLEIYKKK